MRGPYALGDTRAVRAYCRGVIVAAALAGVIVLIAAGLTLAARLLQIGNLDMQALADKLATPEPAFALDWPELWVHAVIPEPGGQPLVLPQVGWLSAIGIAGMDRLVQRNVLAMSGRAVEAAGDVNTLLLDKTGTITLGNRQ